MRAIDINGLEGLTAEHQLTLSRVPDSALLSPSPEILTDRLEQPSGSRPNSQAALNTQGGLYLMPILVMLLLFIPVLLVLLI